MQLRKKLKTSLRIVKDEMGATAVEYVVVAAAISIAILISVKALGVNVNCLFSNVINAVTGSPITGACAGGGGGS